MSADQILAPIVRALELDPEELAPEQVEAQRSPVVTVSPCPCLAEGPRGFQCSHPKGHEGDHYHPWYGERWPDAYAKGVVELAAKQGKRRTPPYGNGESGGCSACRYPIEQHIKGVPYCASHTYVQTDPCPHVKAPGVACKDCQKHDPPDRPGTEADYS